MWRGLKRLVWWALSAVAVVSALVSALEYLEIKPPTQLPLPPRLSPWVRMLAEIPPPVFLAVAVLGVALMLIFHSMRLGRLEASWADMNERQWALFRNWLRERRREVDREISNVTSELHRAQTEYAGYIADPEPVSMQQPQWVDITLGPRRVRLTAEAFSFYEECDPRERQRIERGVSASEKDSFFAAEVRAMANDEHG